MQQTALWTFAEIAAAVTGNISDQADLTQTITEIVIDSRAATAETLFIALQGERVDAHQYVPALLEKEGGIFIIHAAHILPEIWQSDPRLIRVEDSLIALWALGKISRKRSQATIFAITGSVGKTSTKEMLATILSQQGNCTANRGNLNNHYGAPLSCARMPRDADFGVFELGMNHAGELRELTQIVCPHIAIITYIAPAHMAFFESLADVAYAKSEIIEGVQKGGIVIINAHSPHAEILRQKVLRENKEKQKNLTLLTVGDAQECDAQLLHTSYIDQEAVGGAMQVQARILGQEINYLVPVLGMHQVMNSLAALLACASQAHFLKNKKAKKDISVLKASQNIADIQGLSGRGKICQYDWEGGHMTLIDESYNASPAAVRAAVTVLKQMPCPEKGRKIAVLGDMLEMGEASEALHLSLKPDLADIDLVFTVGPEMQKMYQTLPEKQQGACVLVSNDLREKLRNTVQPNDTVLIKGSLGMKMSVLVNAFMPLS